MIIDFEESKLDLYLADICIIGAGIATYSILSVLKDTPARIIIVERGSMNTDIEKEQFKTCEITGHPFAGHVAGREFSVGGTSVTWGGQSLPYTPIDVENKKWVKNSGWPISYEEISRYYPDAERLLNLDEVPYDVELHKLQRLPKLDLDESALQCHFSKWSPRPNLKNDLTGICAHSEQITLMQNAYCIQLIKHENHDKINEIEIQSKGGQRSRVKADKFILSAGGIENARILLMSAPLIRHHTFVGKMFQDHPTAQVATIEATNDKKLQAYFNYFFKGETRFLPRISMTSQYQQQEKLLAATAFVQFIPPPGGLFEALKGIYRSFARMKMPAKKEFYNVFKNLIEINTLAKTASSYLVHRRIYTPRSTARLTIMLEQEPITESYIALSEKPDPMGLPIAQIHWTFTSLTIETLRRFCAEIESNFRKLKLGEIKWDAWIKKSDDEIRNNLIDAYHHMSSTRMSHTIESGVVDTNCKMHGVDNLYIAGSSVFSTTGHSNPTLTIMALAIRLAHYLKSDLITVHDE